MLVSNSLGFPPTGKQQAKGGPVQWPLLQPPREGPWFLEDSLKMTALPCDRLSYSNHNC